MASLNNLYIFVEDESLNREVEVTEHSVEEGIDTTDNVKRKAYTLSLSGKIVGDDSADIQSKITDFMNNGTLVTYYGRNIMTNAQITSFSTSHPNTIWGGCSFSLELKQARIVKNNYTKDDAIISEMQKGGTQQIEKNNNEKTVYHTVKKGDTVYNLVASSNAPYKSFGNSCDWIMQNNPNAFSEKGNFKSLKVGSKIIVGYKS